MSGVKLIRGGVLVPAFSPCAADDAFLPDAFASSLDALLSEPLDGAYICGGTGDGTNMRLDERKAAMRIGVELCKKHGKISLCQVGANTMREALELAEYAAACGADGISSIPLAGYSHADQLNYYKAIIRASGHMQTVLYYMPQPGATFTLSEVLETLSIDGVTGVKCSTNDFFFTQQLMEAKPKGVVLFSGKDEYLAPAVVHGAEGGIGMWATVFPRVYAAIYHKAKAGALDEAFNLQRDLNALCCVVMRRGLLKSYACILHYLGKPDCVFRRPQPRFDKAFYDAFLPEAAPLIDKLILDA